MTAPLFAKAATSLAATLLLAALTPSTTAAPATSDDLGSAGDGGTRSAQVAPMPTSNTVPQSKPVELLLQLQDRPNLYGADSTAAPDPSRRPPKAPPASTTGIQRQAPQEEQNPLLNLKASILGPAQPRQVEASDPSTSMDATAGPGARSSRFPGGGSDLAAREPGQGLLSNPVVRYIRENRGLIVSASLAVLIAVWLTASFSMRRSR